MTQWFILGVQVGLGGRWRRLAMRLRPPSTTSDAPVA